MKLAPKEFDRIVKRALRRIPPEIRGHLEDLVISVRKRPTPAMLREMDIPREETLLGLFQGTPMIEKSIAEPSLEPDAILLFQEPLEEMCETVEELEEEIEITVIHEVAHYIGMSEERLAELGYE